MVINRNLSTEMWSMSVNVDNTGEARKLLLQSRNVNPGLEILTIDWVDTTKSDWTIIDIIKIYQTTIMYKIGSLSTKSEFIDDPWWTHHPPAWPLNSCKSVKRPLPPLQALHIIISIHILHSWHWNDLSPWNLITYIYICMYVLCCFVVAARNGPSWSFWAWNLTQGEGRDMDMLRNSLPDVHHAIFTKQSLEGTGRLGRLGRSIPIDYYRWL